MQETPRPLVAVLDYGIGNLRSAQKGLERVGAEARLTSDAALIRRADGLVLPGVGAFGPCMAALEDAGLDSEARRATAAGVPFLGICIGMQMLFEGSEEAAGRAGLGLLAGQVRRLPDGVKAPQMQWNQLQVRRPDPLLEGLDGSWVYFVHSFAPEPGPATIATCSYGGAVTAAVASGPVRGVQFHPEKSGRAGLALLANFVS
ncbi:MAG: imidazole glycerol phosphate synthase subunit HisH, partial [Acidimicrobiia bacterium]|nr:imidazole glycerol phosphate synthase subunit HisH [Acidimicrobiia bacterium]